MSKGTRIIHSRTDIVRVLRGEYVAQYEKEPTRFDDDTRIFADLHAENDVGHSYALVWLDRVAKRLRIDCIKIKPRESHDYTIGEIVHIIQEIETVH